MSTTRPKKTLGVGQEELRLVVVADERQPALQDPALVDVGDLGREVVALDAVGVVEVVEGVVDGQAEARPPGDQPLLDLGRDADLGHLVEDFRRDRQQPDQRRARRARPSITWSDRSRVKTSESKRGLVMTSVRRSSTLSSTPGSAMDVGQVEGLLLEQELLFVVEHVRIVAPVDRGSVKDCGPDARGSVGAAERLGSGCRFLRVQAAQAVASATRLTASM